MSEAQSVLAVLRDALVSVALVIDANALTTSLILLGATALVAAAATLLARDTLTLALDAAALPVRHGGDAADATPFGTQSDPDAPGRPRPRAPGLLLG